MRRAIPALFVLSACVSGPARPTTTSDAADTPPPMVGVINAYEAAATVPLSKATPRELPGLHNVFQLSPKIVAGSEPHGEEAFGELAKLGVKTILSVDGAVPDAELAARHGMRYVHVPIQYKGVTPEETLRIAKTFRELEGPFYVHCFHGKHRGPAAAAIGRCVIDGASRQQAMAEMRQWMGTAPEYEGLFRTIATQSLPTAAETAACQFDFPAAHRAEGYVAAMTELGRSFDHVKDAAKRGFAADPAHPDLDARNEARKVQDLFGQCRDTEEYRTAKADFRGWLDESVATSAALVAALERSRAGTKEAVEEAGGLVTALGRSCKACHKVYRD